MALETWTSELENKSTNLREEDNPEIEVELDIEGEIICVLNEIKRLRNNKWPQEEHMNKYKKEILCIKESYDEVEKVIFSLKIQVEEGKRIKEFIKSQLKEKEYILNNLEYKIVCVIRDLER
jgi:hypothetical protein